MGARAGGKLKAGLYMISGLLSLLLVTMENLSFGDALLPALKTVVFVAYVAAGLVSAVSFADYFVQFRKLTAQKR